MIVPVTPYLLNCAGAAEAMDVMVSAMLTLAEAASRSFLGIESFSPVLGTVGVNSHTEARRAMRRFSV